MSYKNFYEVIPSLINNVSLEVQMNTPTAGDMTLTLKAGNGGNLSAFNFGRIGFRADSNISGIIESLRVNSNLSLVVPAGATLGFESLIETPFYVYALNQDGTVELAVSRIMIDESQIRSSSTIGTGSDTNNVLYSTTGRTNKPVRLIAKVISNQTTAGTWATSPSVVYMANTGFIRPEPIFFSADSISGQSIPNNTLTTMYLDGNIKDSHFASTNRGNTNWLYTIPERGEYDIQAAAHFTFNATGTRLLIIYLNGNRKRDLYLPASHGSGPEGGTISDSLFLESGDTVHVKVFQNSGGALAMYNASNNFNFISITKR